MKKSAYLPEFGFSCGVVDFRYHELLNTGFKRNFDKFIKGPFKYYVSRFLDIF